LRPLVLAVAIPLFGGLGLMLIWITAQPWLGQRGRAAVALPETGPAVEPLVYRKILVPLDHTDRDRTAVAHAAAMARVHKARIYLLHVEEDVTSQVYGPLSSTAEVQEGERYLEEIAELLRGQGIEVEAAVRHSRDTKSEIVKYARELNPDLLVMGAHGHKRLQDLIFGQTIDGVRHALEVPILIVRD
jgi:manganese transport protein